MRRARIEPPLTLCLVFILMSTSSIAASGRVRTTESFHFTVAAPLAVAFPLFGANRERVWAPDWAPAFIWPSKPDDVTGMVFAVAHGDRQAIWVNTAFDRGAGQVQYVYVLPEVMTTVITLRLREHGMNTDVQVRYERTSLSADADQRVRDAARHDAQAGPEWAGQIANYLARGLPH